MECELKDRNSEDDYGIKQSSRMSERQRKYMSIY